MSENTAAMYAARVASVKAIGSADNKRDAIATDIVLNVSPDYDWNARGAVSLQVHLWATGTDVKSAWPAQKKTENVREVVRDEDGVIVVNENGVPLTEVVLDENGKAKTKNVSTTYGKGVDNIAAAIRKLIATPKPKPFRLAVTASGDDAPVTGTVEIDPEATPELFAALMDLIAQSNVTE